MAEYSFRNPEGVDKQGFVMVLDPKKKDKWNERFMVIKGPTIYIYKSEKCKKKIRDARLVNAQVAPQPLYPKAIQIKPVIGKMITFRTGTDKQVEEWIIALQSSRGDVPMDFTVALGDIRGKDVD